MGTANNYKCVEIGSLADESPSNNQLACASGFVDLNAYKCKSIATYSFNGSPASTTPVTCDLSVD